MANTLWTFGDSYTEGFGYWAKKYIEWKGYKPLNFSDILSRDLSFIRKNMGEGGSDNYGIFETLCKNIGEIKENDFVIIGWSTWEREEWFFQNQYYNVNASGHDKLPEELQELYKEWVITQTQEVLTLKSNFWHDQIYQLHLDLKEKNIKHLFFNCMYNFFQFDNHQDWENKHIGPYNNNDSYYWWLKKQGFKSDKWYHYLEDGHRAWASHLITHIQKHKLL